MKRRGWLIAAAAAGVAAGIAAGVVAARKARDHDPLALSLARAERRIDGIATLLAGVYTAEGLPVPPALRDREVAHIGQLRVVRSERSAV